MDSDLYSAIFFAPTFVTFRSVPLIFKGRDTVAEVETYRWVIVYFCFFNPFSDNLHFEIGEIGYHWRVINMAVQNS
jgi:hypothetical protein